MCQAVLKQFLILSTAIAASPALAQTGPAAADDIVVTATGVAQPADQVGQAITVITREDIERRQTVSVSDLLATTPGVIGYAQRRHRHVDRGAPARRGG